MGKDNDNDDEKKKRIQEVIVNFATHHQNSFFHPVSFVLHHCPHSDSLYFFIIMFISHRVHYAKKKR